MRPKDIGTAAETAAKRFLQEAGFADCDRQPLRGSRDTGDLIVCREPLIIAEVKGGQQAERASAQMIGTWLEQAETEAVHAGADLAVLIVRRFRRPVALWDAWMPLSDWVWLADKGRFASGAMRATPLRGSLGDWAALAKGVAV